MGSNGEPERCSVYIALLIGRLAMFCYRLRCYVETNQMYFYGPCFILKAKLTHHH